jgi:hypothetical protein
MDPEQVHAKEATIAHRLLAGMVAFVARWPRLVLAFALVLCVLSLYLFFTRVEYKSQRDDLIASHKDVRQRWQGYLDEFGKDEDMVVVVQGGDRAAMVAALEALARRVQQHPAQFDRLFYKVDLRHLHPRALLYLSPEKLQQIQDSLASMGRLLEAPFGLGWRCITLQNLVREAEDRVSHLQPGQLPSEADEQLLTQLLSITRSARATLANPADYRNGWGSLLAQPPEQKDLMAEPQYFFSPDGVLAFLLVRPINGEQGSFTADRENIATLRAIIADVRAEFPTLEFGLTGLPVLETDEMVASQRDTALASWLAMAGVAVLYLIVYRGLRYPLMTVSTLLVGIAWSMGWLTLTVGHLNILSAAFAVMLIGMGDYGVLWAARYEQERKAGADELDALQRTAVRVGPGIVTAAVTTALAFFATMLADFQAVAELGWIAGSGVLFCAVACFTVMPALLTLGDRRKIAAAGERPLLSFRELAPASQSSPDAVWLPRLARRPRWVMAVCLLLVAVLGGFACRVEYDHNLLNLQARNLDSVFWEKKLIDHTAGASWHALTCTDSATEARILRERYEKLPVVSRVVEVASLLPSEQEPKLEQLRVIQHRLRVLPARGSVPDPLFPTRSQPLCEDLQKLLDRLQALSPPGRFSPGGFRFPPLTVELRQELQALRDQLVRSSPDQMDQSLLAFDRRLASDLAEDLHRLRDVSTPQPITLADLPAPLRERYVGASGKWLLRVFAAECLWEHDKLIHFVEQVQAVDHQATGKPFLTLEGLRSMKSGYQWAGVYALIAISIVLLIDFRSLRQTLWALAPLGLGAIATLGLLGLCGIPLNPANLIAFPLIMGVGVDNGVHVLHDYLARDRARHYLLSRSIGRGILVAALTTVLGFGALMLGSHRGVVGLGLVLSLGVSCCTASALIFLPALLHLRSDRRVRLARQQREGMAPVAAAPRQAA